MRRIDAADERVKTMAEGNKKAFDSARSAVYVMDPIEDVCIAGGLVMPPNERGTHDTATDLEDPLYDERLTIELEDAFIKGVDAFGVKVPLAIVKRDGRAFVVDGRQRLRAARIVNRARIARGELPMKVKCDIVRSDDTALLGTMILL